MQQGDPSPGKLNPTWINSDPHTLADKEPHEQAELKEKIPPKKADGSEESFKTNLETHMKIIKKDTKIILKEENLEKKYQN